MKVLGLVDVQGGQVPTWPRDLTYLAIHFVNYTIGYSTYIVVYCSLLHCIVLYDIILDSSELYYTLFYDCIQY